MSFKSSTVISGFLFVTGVRANSQTLFGVGTNCPLPDVTKSIRDDILGRGEKSTGKRTRDDAVGDAAGDGDDTSRRDESVG